MTTYSTGRLGRRYPISLPEPRATTGLEAFIKLHRITPMDLVRATGISRRHLFYLRTGSAAPSLAYAETIALACSRLSGTHVEAAFLFASDHTARTSNTQQPAAANAHPLAATADDRPGSPAGRASASDRADARGVQAPPGHRTERGTVRRTRTAASVTPEEVTSK